MTLAKAKLFWKPGDNDKSMKIFALPYDDNMEYRSFVKKWQDLGYRQAIVTSKIMVQIIQTVILERLCIREIETIENNGEFQKRINELLDRIRTSANSTPCGELIEQLDSLAERSPIAIQRVGFIGRTLSGVAVEGVVQSNGMVGANKEFAAEAFENVGEIVSMHLFDC